MFHMKYLLISSYAKVYVKNVHFIAMYSSENLGTSVACQLGSD